MESVNLFFRFVCEARIQTWILIKSPCRAGCIEGQMVHGELGLSRVFSQGSTGGSEYNTENWVNIWGHPALQEAQEV